MLLVPGIIFFFAIALKKFLVDDILENEGTVVLSSIRCSCCHQNLKKCVALLPLIIQICFCGISLVVLATRDDENDENDEICASLFHFLIGSTFFFCGYLLISVLIFFTKRKDRIVLSLIGLTTFGSIVFVIVALHDVTQTAAVYKAQCPRGLFANAMTAKALLLTTSIVTACFTICCRPEGCFYRDLDVYTGTKNNEIESYQSSNVV